ncbi:MAG: hypothetical protein H7Y07_05460 [Pyrinomonadaceae bacterium]|nr:hypothetical protein [Sphingobacteriaceae bacterium]
MKFSLAVIYFSFLVSVCFAQSIDKVGQLISVENYFAASAKAKGIKKAFLAVSDDNTLIFRPEPITVKEFYKNKPDSSGYLSWEPIFAKISKSGDWGYTTGPFVFKQTDTSKTFYGDYVSIWKKNSKGIWKLAVDLGIEHKKPIVAPKMMFSNPKNEIFLKQHSINRLQQREDIVFSSDKLLSTILKADNLIAQTEFIAPESRLLFPGFEPITGKSKITEFWKKQGFKMTSDPTKADRSLSGELAYTYGVAEITQKNIKKKYNYVRIWEVQQGYDWNIILEIYTENPKG